jgi:hypothetical protein
MICPQKVGILAADKWRKLRNEELHDIAYSFVNIVRVDILKWEK